MKNEHANFGEHFLPGNYNTFYGVSMVYVNDHTYRNVLLQYMQGWPMDRSPGGVRGVIMGGSWGGG